MGIFKKKSFLYLPCQESQVSDFCITQVICVVFQEKLNQDLLYDFHAEIMLPLTSAKCCDAFMQQMPESLELVFG